MCAQNFNFALKFHQNGGFSAKFNILGQTFSDKENSFRQFPERAGGAIAPCPSPCHDATVFHERFYAVFQSPTLSSPTVVSSSKPFSHVSC